MSFFSDADIARLSAGTVRAALVLKLDFVSGAKYVWGGKTDIDIDGNTYLPLHGLMRTQGIAFAREPVSQRFTIGVEGLPAETDTVPGSKINVLAAALSATDEVEGQLATASLQLFDDDWQRAGSPYPLAIGFMRKPRVTRTRIRPGQGAVQSISIGAENLFYNRSLPPSGRYTDRDQQARHDGDLICQFQPDLRAKTFTYPDY